MNCRSLLERWKFTAIETTPSAGLIPVRLSHRSRSDRKVIRLTNPALSRMISRPSQRLCAHSPTVALGQF